jgi:predicted GNAT family N-acyltransferase
MHKVHLRIGLGTANSLRNFLIQLQTAADSERGTRYCEVIPCSALAYSQKECKNKTIEIDVTLREVYNTQGFSDCPQVCFLRCSYVLSVYISFRRATQ